MITFFIPSHIQQNVLSTCSIAGTVLDTEQGGKKAQCPSEKIKADMYRVQVNGMWPHVGGAEGWWRELMDDKLTRWGWKEH